jgi:hypothetical protein
VPGASSGLCTGVSRRTVCLNVESGGVVGAGGAVPPGVLEHDQSASSSSAPNLALKHGHLEGAHLRQCFRSADEAASSGDGGHASHGTRGRKLVKRLAAAYVCHMAPHPRCRKPPAGCTPAHRPSQSEAPERRPRGPHRDWGSSTSPAFRVARVALVLLAVLVGSLPFVRGPLDTEAPDAGTPATEAPAVLADAATPEPDAMASLRVPERPPEWQETRCDAKRDETAINRGCYRELARKPPCAEGSFEHDGKCWAAVAKRTRPAQSIEK